MFPLTRPDHARRPGFFPVLTAGLILLTFHLHAAAPASMSSSPASVVQVPARIAGLAFSYLCPADFHIVDLPEETPDFEKPDKFFPLQIAMANYGAVLFTVSARPAFDDGTVEDWAEFLAGEAKMHVTALKPSVVGGLPAMLMEATQESDVGQMRIRLALIEDGSRLVNLMVMAPDALWGSVEPTLQLTLSSFRLAESRGTKVALTRAAAKKATAEPGRADSAVADAPPAPAPEGEMTPFAALALADDANSLDPELPMNVRLRNNGAGLTPRVLETDLERKYAVIGAGALVATFRLPLGWHAIDDGRRTLVFDAGGKIQISVNLRRDDGDSRAMLRQILAEAVKEQPKIDPLLTDFAPDIPGLVLRNYRDGDDVLVQVFVARQLRDDGLAHVARVTAAPEEMSRAMNLAEVILRTLSLDAVPAA